MSPNIVGLDIGSSSIRAVEVRNGESARPIIERFAEVPVAEGSVRRGEVLEVGTVATAIRRLWSAGGFKSRDVILGMGGPRVLSRDLQMPKSSLQQMREALPFHVQELLPVPVAEAILDFYPISESHADGQTVVNGLLVAAIKEAVRANIDAVTRAGLRPLQVDLIPFALLRAFAPPRSTPGLIAMVSIGANTTNVVIARDGIPQFVRIVSSGGDDVTRALVSRLQIPAARAEQLKRDLGLQPSTSPDLRSATEVIYEATRELLTAIRNSLTYYLNSNPGMQLNRIILSGGGSTLPGLAHALGDAVGTQVVTATGLESASVARNPGRDDPAAMATAFGLATGALV
jgi:type IV pilus assembly protein PilM